MQGLRRWQDTAGNAELFQDQDRRVTGDDDEAAAVFAHRMTFLDLIVRDNRRCIFRVSFERHLENCFCSSESHSRPHRAVLLQHVNDSGTPLLRSGGSSVDEVQVDGGDDDDGPSDSVQEGAVSAAGLPRQLRRLDLFEGPTAEW